jgi:hypothetical protein
MTALPVVRLTLLEFRISFDWLGPEFRHSRASAAGLGAGLSQLSSFFPLPELLKAGRVPNTDRRNLCIFNGLHIA